MRSLVTILFSLFFIVMPISAHAETKTESPIKGMSKDELIKLSRSGGPAAVSKDATILLPGADGKLMQAVKGTNGFTCMPDIDGMKVPDPICADAASMQWVNDLMSGAPKPTNAVPGVAYMAKGGWYFKKDGKILMENEPGAEAIQEPPHWMIFWPFENKTVGLPTFPDSFGVYIMWDGTPYAHLMIFQDPNKMK